MFDPHNLIAKMGWHPNQMTTEQLIEAINRIATETRSKGAPGYYNQRMEAIAILAAAAADQLHADSKK